MMEHLKEFVHSFATAMKHTMDATSIGVLLGTLFGMLPAIAALLTIVWTAIRIWETKTVQGFVAKRREKKEGC